MDCLLFVIRNNAEAKVARVGLKNAALGGVSHHA
jgi:hypothetical protein